ncbi:glutathione synthase [Haplosporangium bisporale]|nr:glutathione synthase [Haplosporangium bisporale]
MTAQSQHRITHCIFDMDGLLINTETLYTEISSEILARYGKTYGFELKSKLMGLREKESAEILVRETGADMTPEEYLHERHLLQLERFPHCVPLPGVMDSPIGVQAGVNASMKVLWVPDENISRLYPNLEGPTLRIDSLEEFDPVFFGLPPFDS